MITQSVANQTAGLLTNTAVSTSGKSKQTGDDFQQLMNSGGLKTSIVRSAQKNLQGSGKYGDNNRTMLTGLKKTREQASDTQNNKQSKDGNSNSAVTDQVQSKQSAALKTDSRKTTVKAASVKISDTAKEDDNEKEDSSVDDQIAGQIAAMLQSIQETAMKLLKLSPEEFNQLLNDQGMSAVDLLQPENLQQLVLAANGQADIMAALTDENLASTINQLIENVDAIKEESNLGLTKDQVKTFLAWRKTADAAKTETITDINQTGVMEEPLNSEIGQIKSSTENNAEPKKEDGTSKLRKENNIQTDPSKLAVTNEKAADAGAHAGNDSKQDLNNPDQFQTFVDNLVNSSQKVQSDFNKDVARVTELRDIANQIIDRIKVSVSQDNTSMELSLNPDHLGKVNFSVQSKDGVMTAHFIVQNEISKEAIESQMHILRETLNEQGIRIEGIEVTVSANAFAQNNNQSSDNQSETQKHPSGRKISLDEARSMMEEPETQEDVADLTGALGSVVDYTA